MKALFLYCFIFVFIIKINAQINLVPNPSFEDTIQCPTNISQLYNCAFWVNPNGAGPDYFNSCADYNTGVSVPNNATGYQIANTGNAYVGLLLYQRTISGGPYDYREYIQAMLTDTLKNGKNYCVSFYVNYPLIANIAIDNIGVYISNTPIGAATPIVLPYTPQIMSPTGVFLTDTINWYKVEGTYTATGGEKYITIGNFKNATNTDTIHTDPFFASSSYYFIDDVSVICCSCDTTQPSNLNIPNVFTPNNDGVNDEFKIKIKNITALNCKLYNRWGVLIGELKNVNDVWDGRTNAGIECIAGVYYYILTAKGEEGKEYNERGFVQLIR